MNKTGCQILLETKRLVLRQFTVADAEHIFALDNDPAVMRYLNGGEPTPRAVVEQTILPTFMEYDQNVPGFGVWAVDEKSTGDFLGWVSMRPSDEMVGEVILGYRFRKATWGKGFATEAVRALIDKGFTELGVQRVVATTYQDNVASQRVMEKLGMRLVRRFRLTPEDLGISDTYHSESTEVWDGDDVEYALEGIDWQPSYH